MLILEEIKQLSCDRRELRRFGWLVGGVLAALGLWFLARGKAHPAWPLIPGILLLLGASLRPRFLKPLYVQWMSLAIVLGFIVSHVLLTLFFFLVLTPIGLAARLSGKDFLRLKLERQASTYWLPRQRKAPPAPDQYERQF